MTRPQSHSPLPNLVAGFSSWLKWRHYRCCAEALALPAVLGVAMFSAPSAEAQTLSVLYNFKGSPDGSVPAAGVIRDAAGNLYGTTYVGGNNNGTVFEVSSQGTETILHTFKGIPDGSEPWAAVVRDPAGNLYGTTAYGGAFNFGTVFKVTPTGHERVLYSFTGPPDGATPFAALIRDSAGNLYGTTSAGGSGTCNIGGQQGCGTVFMVSASGTERVLYSFAGGTDGVRPMAGLVPDAAGNLYGTTTQGGAAHCSDFSVSGCGTVFKLSKTGIETVLHSFAGYPNDGEGPTARLIFGAKGVLYGTTLMGGAYSYGTVFKVNVANRKETVMYSFTGGSTDGINPAGGLTRDAAGNLYGITQAGGGAVCAGSGCGTIFRLDKNGNETVLCSFAVGNDASVPAGDLIRDSAGNLYGTTSNGGTAGGPGTVYKLIP
jgi:uncharacterized repeat protein (TIGR03803 family)